MSDIPVSSWRQQRTFLLARAFSTLKPRKDSKRVPENVDTQADSPSCDKWKVRPALSPLRPSQVSQLPHLRDETKNPSPAVPRAVMTINSMWENTLKSTHVGMALSVFFCIFILKHIYTLLQVYPGTCLA